MQVLELFVNVANKIRRALGLTEMPELRRMFAEKHHRGSSNEFHLIIIFVVTRAVKGIISKDAIILLDWLIEE